jgi:hypothetical protein
MDTGELKRLEGLVHIWTAYGETDKDKDQFNLWKKAIRRRILSSKQRGRWIELLSGEWSETNYNQGNVKFMISHSDDKKAWALLSVAPFPSRIIAVADSSSPMTVEEVGALMLRRVQEAGGPYCEFLHENGDIDIDRLWSIFSFK